jgi:HK97 family phage portal protein
VRNPFTKILKRSTEWINAVLGTLTFSTGTSYNVSKASKISTVYRCVTLLSDSVASLPLLPYNYRDNWKYINYDGPLFNLLNVQPNPFVSAYMFKKLAVVNMLMKGRAIILITRDRSGKVLRLTNLDPDSIKIEVTETGLEYINTLLPDGNNRYDQSQIIDIINYTTNGIDAKSVLTYAADTLGIAYNSEQHASNFWKSGGALAGILRPVAGATMNSAQAKKAKDSFMGQINSELGGSANSIVVLGDGLEYQPMTVNPKDSQLLESRAFNVAEICRFFNVPPSMAYSESGKFSTAEQQSLDFLNNSLNPLLEKIESEMFRKLFLPGEWNFSELKFDTENYMRLDATTRADYYLKMFQVGGYTTNEIREKLNASYPVKGGNRAFIQVNLQPVDNLISEQPLTDPLKPLDNKVI